MSEYEQRAAECRDMAAQTSDPGRKSQLEEMATTWDALARERAARIRKGRLAPTQAVPTETDK